MCSVKFKQPCNDCPFRRDSTPGWCGDSEPEWFVESALTDYAEYQAGSKLAPCHQTVDYSDPDWGSKMDEAAACVGALIFCKNRGKSPRDFDRAQAVKSVDSDYGTVFARPEEFIEHHRGPTSIRSWEKSASSTKEEVMETIIQIGVTKERFKALVNELQKVVDDLDNYLNHTIYCEPNGSGYGEEVQLNFSNDDMETDQNPRIDGSKIYVSIEEVR